MKSIIFLALGLARLNAGASKQLPSQWKSCSSTFLRRYLILNVLNFQTSTANAEDPRVYCNCLLDTHIQPKPDHLRALLIPQMLN